ncbi:MAG: hypothetical protein KKE17_00755 [Proteobacteria bacterium]|nr:hypothetical protein [Pseudomonadota bacterium]MBU1708510.1 hypothetical protein [Pseudomonadota bacterium]
MKRKIVDKVLALLIIAGGIAPFVILLILSNTAPQFDPAAMYRPEGPLLLPQVDFSILEQLVVCFVSFVLKPLYELIALIIVIKLWRSTDRETAAMRYGLIAFFTGENACALNYLLFQENSLVLEYLHLYGMLVGFGFICYSVLITLDARILKYSLPEKKCALLFFCKSCYKSSPVSCTIRRLFQLLLIAASLIALMPLVSRLGGYFVIGNVFGTQVVFGHSLIQQIMETRVCPVVAIVFFAIAWLVLQVKKEKGLELAKILFAIGLGPLGFSIMRFIVFWGFAHNPIWADIWEEITEFILIAAIYYLLFLSRGSARNEKSIRRESHVA